MTQIINTNNINIYFSIYLRNQINIQDYALKKSNKKSL
jgi:hypothetical protein